MSLSSARRRFRRASSDFRREERKKGPLTSSNPKVKELKDSAMALSKERSLLARQEDVTPEKKRVKKKKAKTRYKKTNKKPVIKPGKKFLAKSPAKIKGLKI